ncbi:MAG: 23S rRNA (pseudouridine(1915)-N(3))-methyltransferase RlmH [Burkholderiaceae bacterium]
MRIHVLAVGTRMPDWVRAGVDEYTRRMPAELPVQWHEIRAEARNKQPDPARCMAREAERILAAVPGGAWRVILDERGRDRDTLALAQRMQSWRERSAPVAMIIGGPDGLDPALRESADETLSLSRLTLPHPIVRIVLAEQLYRAWSVITGHPYHRE